MGNARIYAFVLLDGKMGYLPVVPVVRDYLRHERRKADNALMEFLTLTHLNGIAKYRPQDVDTRNPARVRDRLKEQIFHSLDTRNEPFRNNPEGLLARKVRALADFCVIPQSQSQMNALTRMFPVETVFTVEENTEDEDRYDEADYDDSDDNHF